MEEWHQETIRSPACSLPQGMQGDKATFGRSCSDQMRPQLNFLAYMQNTMCRTGMQFRVGEKVDGAKYKNVLEENSNSSNAAKATTEWFGLKPIEVLPKSN
ncbi:hypothetical protein CHARACLAT_008523 [Characodon lateralis]|uniref:Uncharacterized protein n=1 Tax=Characodon lateralis TaxID=208331 RepID=A0ABU7E8F7_9TELE|nr:hypothetical protein [Characodon lateralis]